jgi:transcriptional regulator with XRE-family HTH domain
MPRRRGESSVPVSVERSELAKSIGNKLREARELAGFSQNNAAKMLGYRNSSKLAKIENGSDTNSVPLWLILRAARLYQVSVDYLFGESDDWELSAQACLERDVSKWVIEAMELSRKRDMEIMKKLHSRFYAFFSSVDQMHSSADELEAAFRRFIELNPKFETDMRGSYKLLNAVSNIVEVAKGAKTKTNKFRQECSMSQVQSPQVGILDLEYFIK